jgi:hypothetical protein
MPMTVGGGDAANCRLAIVIQPFGQGGAYDRASARIQAHVAGRRPSRACGLTRQGRGRNFHLYLVHQHLPRSDADDVLCSRSAQRGLRRQDRFRFHYGRPRAGHPRSA